MTDPAHAESNARIATYAIHALPAGHPGESGESGDHAAVDAMSDDGAMPGEAAPATAAPDLAPLAGVSGRVFRLCEASATVVVPLVILALGWRLGAGVTASTFAIAIVGLLVGYVAADLGSGLVHWAFDTWGSVETPLLGRSIIRTFREHHFDDKAITRHDFVETNGTNALAALPVMLLGFTGGGASPWSIFAMAFVAALGGLTAFTGQIHKWAHSERVPRVVAALQRARLILDAQHHGEHHVAPYTRQYCITTGWCNPVLEKLGVLRSAERLINALFRRGAAARPVPSQLES